MVYAMAQGSRARRTPAEGPAGAGREEVAVGGADVPARRGAAPAPEHVLAHHELAVVLADGARGGAEPGIGGVGARGPLPGVAEDAVGRHGGPWMGRAVREEVVAQEVVALAVRRGDGLPLGLGRQPHAGPVGERVRLVVADVADGLVGVDRPQTRQRELQPAIGVVGIAPPVEGGVPVLGVDDGPAVGEPELGPAVAVVLHEGEPLAAGDRAVGQPEGRQVHRVHGELVVEAEPLAAVADLDGAAVVLEPAGLGWMVAQGVPATPPGRPGGGGSATGRA